jgi:CheY-like chemotaxis protein
MMPVMDGREFLEHQSRDPALLDIPYSDLDCNASASSSRGESSVEAGSPKRAVQND